MAEITNGDPSRKELYRLLYNDKTPGVGDKVKKYSFSQFENKLLTDENVQDKIGSYLMEKGLVEDLVDFQGKYISTKPAPAPTAAPVAPVQQVVEPPVGIAAPKAIQEPTPSVTDYAREMAFEPQVETPVKPIGVMAPQPIEEPIPSVTETAREMAFKPPVEPKKPKEKERGFMEWTGDVFGTISAGGERIAKNILAGIGHYAQAQAATDPMASLPYEKRQQMLQEAGQTMYDIADAAQKEFQNEVAKRNIETSVLQAIDKKQYKNIPEAVLYTVGDAAMQIIPSVLTMGGSTYLQTLPAAYRDGVEAIAKEKGISPEQVIASGDDAIVVAGISSGFQSALENIGAGQVSKAIASKGAYKAIRDWLLKQNVNKNLARGAALLGVGVGEGTTEYIQEGTGQTGVIAAKSPTAKAFFERLPNELFTAEAEKQRRESFVGGLIGGGGLAGVGQAITKAFEKPPVAPQPPVASEAPVAPEAPIVPPAAPPVAPIEEAPVEEVTTPETGMFAGIEGPTEEAPATSGLFEGITGPPQEAPVAAEEAPVAAEEELVAAVPSAPAPKGKKGVTIEFPTKLSVGEVKPYAKVPDNYYRPDQQLKFNQGNYYEPVRVIAHPDVIRAITIGSRLGDAQKRKTVSDSDIEFANKIAKQLGYTDDAGNGISIMLHRAVKDLAKENRSKDEEVFMVIGNEAKAPNPAPVTPTAPKAQPVAEKKVKEMSLEELQAESSLFDEKIKAEKERLKKIAPNRQVVGGAGIDNLSPEDAARYAELNDEIGRRQGTSQEEAKRRVAEKREQRRKEQEAPKEAQKPIEFGKKLEEKYGVRVDLLGRLDKGDLTLSRIEVPKGQREKGIGTKVMEEIIKYADENGKRIVLSPTKEFGATSVDRLRAFYKGFGFVENKGNNKDFTIKELMYRLPSVEAKPTTGTPQEGSKVNLPPQSKYTTEPRKMVFKDGEWKQEVGGEIVSVGEPVQKQAQEAFSGKTEIKAEETKPAPKAPETKGAEEEKPIHTETDKKGRVSKFFEKKQTKPDGTTVTRFEFERSDKGNERITATTGVPVEVALGDKWVIDDTYVPKGAKVIKIVEIREGDGNVRATVIFEAEDGTRFDGEVVLFEKGKPKGKPSKEAAIPEEPTQKGVRFEKGSKLTEEEKREVYKTLKDSYKEMGRPYTMEIRTSQYTGRDYEARVWLEKASDFMETSDVTGRKLRYYISLPDGTIAHPTELFPNVSASEMNAAQRSIEYNQRVAMQKMDDITSQLKKSGEIDKVVSAIALALENGAVFEKEYDSGDVGQKDAAVYLRFPNGAIKTIPDYVISTKEELLGFNRQDLDKYKSGDSKEKIFSTVYQPDWEQFYNENKSAETKPAETKPTAEFTSKQEGNASTEFDGTKKPSKIKMKTFDNKYGKGAFERMQNITQNFEDIMDGLSEKIKQDCL